MIYNRAYDTYIKLNQYEYKKDYIGILPQDSKNHIRLLQEWREKDTKNPPRPKNDLLEEAPETGILGYGADQEKESKGRESEKKNGSCCNRGNARGGRSGRGGRQSVSTTSIQERPKRTCTPKAVTRKVTEVPVVYEKIIQYHLNSNDFRRKIGKSD